MSKYLKPAQGRTVDQEDGTPWPADGMDAPNTLFVRRRIADGDLIEAQPAAIEPVEPENDPPTEPPRNPRKPKGDN
jgi:hypothetical protein